METRVIFNWHYHSGAVGTCYAKNNSRLLYPSLGKACPRSIGKNVRCY